MLSDVGPDEAEMLIAADPATFHTTPHFTDARCLLARLESLQPDVLHSMIERRWRKIALKAWVKAYDTR
jgi:hypothetical protein